MNPIKLEVLSVSMICALGLTACANDKIQDSVVSDRVKACSAGFSDDLQAQLHASLSKANGGDLTADIKQETQALIFAETPIDQHLQVYEDYIKCVESNWNVPTVKRVGGDPWDPRHK